MGFEELIAFVMFLVPGALTETICQRLRPRREPNSDFQRVFHSLLYGGPVLLINWLIVRSLFSLGNDLNAAAGLMGSPWFILAYAVSSVVVSVVVACVLTWATRYSDEFFSFLSRILRMPVVNSETPWDTMFFHNNPQAIEVIMPDGPIVRGFARSTSPTAEHGEILLTDLDILDQYADCFKKVTRVHINSQTGVVIRELSMDDYLAKIKEREEADERQAKTSA